MVQKTEGRRFYTRVREADQSGHRGGHYGMRQPMRPRGRIRDRALQASDGATAPRCSPESAVAPRCSQLWVPSARTASRPFFFFLLSLRVVPFSHAGAGCASQLSGESEEDSCLLPRCTCPTPP